MEHFLHQRMSFKTCLYNCTETYLIYGLYIDFASSVSREAGVIAYILSKKRVING